MIRKYHNHTLQSNPRHGEEEPQNTNRKTIKVKQPIKGIAKVEGHKLLYNKTRTKYRAPTNNGSSQQQNHRLRTDSNLSHWGGGGLNAFCWYQTFTLDSAFVKSWHKSTTNTFTATIAHPKSSRNLLMCIRWSLYQSRHNKTKIKHQPANDWIINNKLSITESLP